MSIKRRSGHRVFIYSQYVDMRSGFERLSYIVREEVKKNLDVIENFHAWMLKTRERYLESTGIYRAISYCLKFWRELTLFTKDLSLPLSNTDVERAVRHVVMGRKNFGGSKSIKGADTAAAIYTVIESCKRVGLQPAQYRKYLIEARWYRDQIQTPYERAIETLGPNLRVEFPEKNEWKIASI